MKSAECCPAERTGLALLQHEHYFSTNIKEQATTGSQIASRLMGLLPGKQGSI